MSKLQQWQPFLVGLSVLTVLFGAYLTRNLMRSRKLIKQHKAEFNSIKVDHLVTVENISLVYKPQIERLRSLAVGDFPMPDELPSEEKILQIPELLLAKADETYLYNSGALDGMRSGTEFAMDEVTVSGDRIKPSKGNYRLDSGKTVDVFIYYLHPSTGKWKRTLVIYFDLKLLNANMHQSLQTAEGLDKR